MDLLNNKMTRYFPFCGGERNNTVLCILHKPQLGRIKPPYLFPVEAPVPSTGQNEHIAIGFLYKVLELDLHPVFNYAKASERIHVRAIPKEAQKQFFYRTFISFCMLLLTTNCYQLYLIIYALEILEPRFMLDPER